MEFFPAIAVKYMEVYKMIEKYLVKNCSPTLASIKTANLFSINHLGEENLKKQIEEWNHKLCDKGVSLILLRNRNNIALVYVCRKSRLREDLSKAGVAEFLKGYGYTSTDVDYAIERLSSRLSTEDEFPHEIGIFLSYPLGDVIGFIENAGKNSKCTGCWKVYCNECEAVKTFAKFKKCREVYSRLWSEGSKTVWQLTVAV